jgi:hypothetical protein
MFRNQYDTDVTTWSPQGRIHQVFFCLWDFYSQPHLILTGPLLQIMQVEYAMEAVKQGSACVGARSKTHAVMAALKRSTNDMSSYQKKIFKVDDHMVLLLSCVCLSSNMRKSRNLEGFDVMFDTWLLPALHTPHCRTCVVRVSLAHSSHPRFPEVVFGTFRFYRVLERKKSTTAAYLVRHLCIFSPLSLIYFEGYCRRYDCFLGLTNAEKQPF